MATMDYDLHERIESHGSFSETVRLAELRYREALVCFISFDGESIAYAGLLRRQRKVTSTKCVVEFSNFVDLGRITPADILGNTDPWDDLHVVLPAIEMVHAVPDSTWSRLMNTIKRLRPRAASALSTLENLARPHSQTQAERGYDVMAEEKDAIGLAMSIFGAKRDEELTNWAQTGDQPAPFLAGLRGVELIEDTMINHDAAVFGSGWESLQRYHVGAVEFRHHETNQRLTIMNVNRNKVEHTLGVDLVYYHHQYRSFVMVQYKRMVKENVAGGKVEHVYRPTDVTYEEEVLRMRRFETGLPDLHVAGAEDCGSYRLHAGGSYFKLCPSTDFDPLSTDLINGMYLPLDYWGILERSPSTKGTRGGFVITRNNVERYINNTLFIQLVQAGWIGTRLMRTDKLTTLIRELVEQNRSVLAAISA